MVHPSAWMWMLDTDKRPWKKTWSSRNVISWTEKKSNEEVMEMTGYKRFLLKIIRKRQLQFFGHIKWADRLEKQILSGKTCGTKSIGRQRTKSTDNLNKCVTRKESLNNELIGKTDHREDLKAMIVDAFNTHGTWWCTCIWSDGWRLPFFFACFYDHAHSYFNIIYLVL